MKIARFDDGSGPRIGIVIGDRIIPVGAPHDIIDLIGGWGAMKGDLQAVEAAGGGAPLTAVRLLAPVPRPGKIFAIGLNYADHIEESKMVTPKHQVWFTKAVTSVTGPFDPVQIPKVSPFVDYEAEPVAVIGKGGRHISAADASGHVFGYCVGNDVTERVWQHRTAQWSLGKSFDTHVPIGPWITTSDEVGDPHGLGIRCLVNGEGRQDSNTRHLVFDVFAQIEHLSQAMTLKPGDLIFTGTPGGIGAAMEPRRFLMAGDIVRCEIDRLGHIENPFAPEA